MSLMTLSLVKDVIGFIESRGSKEKVVVDNVDEEMVLEEELVQREGKKQMTYQQESLAMYEESLKKKEYKLVSEIPSIS